jgi:catechol 2,3-dioxygenase-like lactoylglutathione lyase family enzyme
MQIAMVSADLPATVRRYTEVFGFADAGGRTFWGSWLARIQGLGADAATVLWWMVGRQDLVQLEVFGYTHPVSRPQPPDWRPSDLGWAGWSLAVPDFDAALRRLGAGGVATITDPVVHAGLRRVAFRDPDVGMIVEVLEDGAGVQGGIRPHHYDLAPAVVSVTLSVADLAQTRRFLIDTAGMRPTTLDLHPAGTEGLWGLPGARRESVVLRGAGDVLIELVQYRDPVPWPRPHDHRLSDLGIMNVGFGYRERAWTDELLERVRAGGYGVSAELPDTPAGGVYVTDLEGTSYEVMAQPREFDADFGFQPQPALLRPALWPQADQRDWA